MDIIVNVVNQKMYIASSMECLVSGSQHFVKFKFNLSEEWDGLTTLAQFQQDGKAYNSYLDENNCVYLPTEIKAGDCKLMLYGSCDTIIGTTNYLALKIDENIFVYDAQTPDIPDEVYDQLVGRAELELKLSGKVDKVEGMGLSKNDFSDDYKLTLDEFPQTIESILEQVENSKCDVSNLSDGSAEGSLRSVDAQGEDENYKMGDFAVALGQGAMAIGESSFAEGVGTRAEGYGSHAEGMFTVAKGNNQHVQGVANIVDEEARYAHIVGNGNPGTYNSNAHTLDWDGNAWFSGDVYVGGTSQDDENATKLSSVATDISQVKEKLEQVEEMSVKRTALPDGPIDLNTFITSGWWYTTEQRIDITNTPKDLAELELIVTKDVLSITQILIACDGGYGICYRFSHNSGKNWTDWQKIASDADFSSLNETLADKFTEIENELDSKVSSVNGKSGETTLTGDDILVSKFNPNTLASLGNYTNFKTDAGYEHTTHLKIGTFKSSGYSDDWIILKITGGQANYNRHSCGFKVLTLASSANTVNGGTYAFGTFYDFVSSDSTPDDIDILLVHQKDTPKSAVDVFIQFNDANLSNRLCEYFVTVEHSVDKSYNNNHGWTTDKECFYDYEEYPTPTTNADWAAIVPKVEIDINKIQTDIGTLTADVSNLRFADENFQSKICEIEDVIPTNLVNGSAEGSLRGINAKAEGNGYTIGQNAVAIGYGTKASGRNSHAEGYNTTALGDYSHAEGYGTRASEVSHAEGSGSNASGDASHAEGLSTIASGRTSHAEGSSTTASGDGSHAEGVSTTASGYSSHAEGESTIASGEDSHAEGKGTIANGYYSHAQGKYNIADNDNKYLHIVGNGEDKENRSNAHTLDWDGNAWFSGDVYVGGTSQDDENATKLSSVATDITQVKEKLDGIEEGANKTIVDSELSDTSTNPLQNKVVTEKINSANSTISSIYNRVKNQVSYLARTQTANTTLLKIGTFTGDGSGGRAIITLNGKKGWNYKNDGGLKVLTLSSNIPSDTNGICTGATFYDFGGSNDAGSEILDSVQDVQILLVRPQDYAVRKVDVYIKFNSAYQYNSFFVTADWAPGTTWEVDVKAITTTDTDPTTNALSSFVVPKKQFASLEKVETKADTETGTCTLTAYSDTVFGTVSNEILLNWASDTLKYYTTGSTDADGTLTVQGTGNARIINAYNINATGTVGVEFAVSGTGAIKIEIKGGGTTYTSGNISLSTNTQKIQITHATSGIAVLDDMEINIYASGETALTIENLLKITEASTRTLTGNYELVGNQVTVSVFVDNLQNGGEITLYPLPFVPKIAKSGVCGAFSSSSYSAIYYDIDGGTTAMIYLNDAPQANKQLTFYYTV